MHTLRLDKLQTILCLGAHSDDLEIGCGGAIIQLLDERPGLGVHWVVFSAEGPRAAEATKSANALLSRAATKQVEIHSFPDTSFRSVETEIKQQFRQLRGAISPDLIFTHRLEDRHQDHRLLAEFTWNTFRDHLILEYEIPKYEGDLGAPNLFVPLSDAACRQKCEHLLEHFASQRQKPWFTADTFRALLRLRGVECNAPSGFAEGFYCRKVVVG